MDKQDDANHAAAGRVGQPLGAGAGARCTTPDKCRIVPTGPSWTTGTYYPPIYDGHGNNLNPDRNTTYSTYRCETCGREWNASMPPWGETFLAPLTEERVRQIVRDELQRSGLLNHPNA